MEVGSAVAALAHAAPDSAMETGTADVDATSVASRRASEDRTAAVRRAPCIVRVCGIGAGGTSGRGTVDRAPPVRSSGRSCMVVRSSGHGGKQAAGCHTGSTRPRSQLLRAACLRQPGHLGNARSSALRPRLTAGVPFRFTTKGDEGTLSAAYARHPWSCRTGEARAKGEALEQNALDWGGLVW